MNPCCVCASHLIPCKIGAAEVGVSNGLDLEYPVLLSKLVELHVSRVTQNAIHTCRRMFGACWVYLDATEI